MRHFQTFTADSYLSLLIFDAKISSIGSKEASNAGARLLVCALASKTHQQLPHILSTMNASWWIGVVTTNIKTAPAYPEAVSAGRGCDV